MASTIISMVKIILNFSSIFCFLVFVSASIVITIKTLLYRFWA